jgi:hypothetical protein
MVYCHGNLNRKTLLKARPLKNLLSMMKCLITSIFFYRTTANVDYSFLGKLKYISHDSSREKPVYFQWQILDWNTVNNEEFAFPEKTYKTEELEIKNTLLLDSAPEYNNERKGITTEEFRGRKGVDYSKQDKSNKKLGLLGEKLVLEFEIKILEENNRYDLAKKVSHHAVTIGDGLGYDILSFDLNGKKKFIEVKTTRGLSKTDFFVTKTELQRSKAEAEFYLYRVYNFCEKTNSGNLYIKKGVLSDNFDLIPNEYKARV